VTSDGRVFRQLSERGLADWKRLQASGLLDELTAEGKLPETHEFTGELEDAGLYSGVAGVLEHEPIPFVSYPY